MKIFIIKRGEALGKLINLIGAENLPGLTRSIKIAANETLREWVKMVDSSSSKEGWKKKYRDSINIDAQENPLEVSVSASGMFVNFVEDGVKRFDMKIGLLNGPKVRFNDKGEPYNIVFFRKGVPTSTRVNPMPKPIYKMAKKLGKSDIMKRYRVVGIGDEKRKLYTKADKLKGKSRDDIYGGLLKTGSPGHSVYGTFRIVSKRSVGWIYPGVPASPVYSKLEMVLQPKIKRILKEGLLEDIKAGVDFLKEKGY